jgi:peptidoglycan/LPS O-acetylase OafA/YrhL
MALLAGFVRRGSLVVLFAVAAVILFVSRFSHEIFVLVPGLGLLLRIFESNALYLLFMLIGVVFSYHARDRVNTSAAIASVIVLFIAFVVCWPLTFFRGDYPLVTYNYGYALIVFTACYAFRRYVPDTRAADFFAAISYPLHLVHSLVGYVVLTVLLAAHVNVVVATLTAFAVAIVLALALHRAVETPTQELGKSRAARVAPVRRAP